MAWVGALEERIPGSLMSQGANDSAECVSSAGDAYACMSVRTRICSRPQIPPAL